MPLFFISSPPSKPLPLLPSILPSSHLPLFRITPFLSSRARPLPSNNPHGLGLQHWRRQNFRLRQPPPFSPTPPLVAPPSSTRSPCRPGSLCYSDRRFIYRKVSDLFRHRLGRPRFTATSLRFLAPARCSTSGPRGRRRKGRKRRGRGLGERKAWREILNLFGR